MTTPEQLAKTVREALRTPDHRRAAIIDPALAALDSLLAAYEEMRQERDDADHSATIWRDAARILEARAEAAERERGEWQNRFELIAEENRDNLFCLQTAEREVERLNHESGALESEGRRLREALAYYADYDNWEWPDPGVEPNVIRDDVEGNRARRALGSESE